jgi:hypothetical protein
VSPHQRRPDLLVVVVVCLVATVVSSRIAPAASSPVPEPAAAPAGCQVERAVTTPASVDVAQVLGDVYALRDDHHAKLFSGPNPTLDRALTALFDRSSPKSKLEQFYSLLFYIATYASHPGDEISFDLPPALTLLVSSKVFSDPEFPRQIARIQLTRKDRGRPHYQVGFDKPEVWLPLNKGLGFGIVREGMCQHAKALVFYGSFAFSLGIKSQGLEVSNFDNVDLWGAFGSRGLVDIDVNYVSVKSVEFQNGSAMGLVKAKVSRKEFAINQHSFLLELVTKYLVDKSVQPIDW